MEPKTDIYDRDTPVYTNTTKVKEGFFMFIVLLMAVSGFWMCVEKLNGSRDTGIDNIVIHENDLAYNSSYSKAD